MPFRRKLRATVDVGSHCVAQCMWQVFTQISLVCLNIHARLSHFSFYGCRTWWGLWENIYPVLIQVDSALLRKLTRKQTCRTIGAVYLARGNLNVCMAWAWQRVHWVRVNATTYSHRISAESEVLVGCSSACMLDFLKRCWSRHFAQNESFFRSVRSRVAVMGLCTCNCAPLALWIGASTRLPPI